MINSTPTLRELVRRRLEHALVSDDAYLDPEFDKPEDRALFVEISQGCLREWMFLEWAISEFAKTPPKGKLSTIVTLSAYQLLFLDRVPDHAVYSEAKHLCMIIRAAEAEVKFVHGVLKALQKEKPRLLSAREESLGRAARGELPDSPLDWAVLNVPPALLDALTIVDEKTESSISNKAAKHQARERAVRAVAAMKQKPPLLGYVLPVDKASAQLPRFESTIAPRAVLLSDLDSESVRVQGEASQWACEIAARQIEKLAASGSRPVRVLEMAAGKGGKFLGTLSALKEVPALEWVAVDSSEQQLQLFESSTMRLAAKIWPKVKVRTVVWDWRESTHDLGQFDFVWLDAPCTGFGTLSKLPEISLKRGVDAYENAQTMAAVQTRLCNAAASRLKKGAKFFYTVCTLTRPETLEVVKACEGFLKRVPEAQESLWPGSPPAPRAEGFFAALF